MNEIREYLDRDGRNPFSAWFARLNSDAARRVTTSLYRIGLGNFSNVKGVDGGVFE
jgi:putative component of toxin-antitoxin plasmid stabilization module